MKLSKLLKLVGFIIIGASQSFSSDLLANDKAVGKENTLAEFVKLPNHRNLQISPDGKHLSVVYSTNDFEALAILDTKTRKPVASFKAAGSKKGIGEVHWVSNTRLVYGITHNSSWDKGYKDEGQLVGVSIDGSDHEIIFGHNAGEMQTGSRLKKKESSYGHHSIIDLLKDDPKHILIAFYPWKVKGSYWVINRDATPMVYKLNVYNGRKIKVTYLPAPLASAIVDNSGEVRFAVAVNKANEWEVYYRDSNADDWTDFNLKNFEGTFIVPRSFTKDNNKVYLTANVNNKTEGVYLFDLTTQKYELLFQDEELDISHYVYDYKGRRVVAVATEQEVPSYHYLDPKDKKASLHKSLMSSFAGFNVQITSATEDEKQIIIHAYSDTNPGDFYLFNTEDLKAEFLLTRRAWIKLSKMRPKEGISIETRDGEEIFGYLTKPSKNAKNVPMVVLPHGGPHGIRDSWEFDWEAQLLASKGYAVLQVNFRGSGGYGQDFLEAGYGKWGAMMQDDLTDATLQVINSGVADAKRVCIYGASYGGYAALMGAVKEPELYRCTIGSMGVYDLPLMFEEGDIAERDAGIAYLKEALGTDVADQKMRSPAYNVDKIKADILLIHGEKDQRAPIEQVESLMSALDKQNKPYEYLLLDYEGHGYYDESSRLKVYSKILEFLESKIGHGTNQLGK
ncbi:alpha/beta hydrolase family protein [Aliikangiella sp. IMCC44653]